MLHSGMKLNQQSFHFSCQLPVLHFNCFYIEKSIVFIKCTLIYWEFLSLQGTFMFQRRLRSVLFKLVVVNFFAELLQTCFII